MNECYSILNIGDNLISLQRKVNIRFERIRKCIDFCTVKTKIIFCEESKLVVGYVNLPVRYVFNRKYDS